jgi:hypothetical protein
MNLSPHLFTLAPTKMYATILENETPEQPTNKKNDAINESKLNV